MEPAFNIKLRQSVFLVKLQGPDINDDERVRDRVCDVACF